MPVPLAAAELLDREFLEIRARILEIASALDRIDRADGDVAEDRRMDRIRHALERLTSGQPQRAEQIQLLFSLDYQQDWRTTFGLAGGTSAALNAKKNGR